MERLKQSLREAPVVDRGEYQYFVHPVTDCIPAVEPEILAEIVEGIQEVADVEAADRIFTAEAMGIHHATALSVEAGIPFTVARKRSYGFEDEVAVHQETGYDVGELYVNGLEEGDEVVLVDDVLSTGGTIRALYDALDSIGVEIIDAVVVIRRAADDMEDLPVDVKYLVDLDVVDGEVVIEE